MHCSVDNSEGLIRINTSGRIVYAIHERMPFLILALSAISYFI